MINEDFEIRCPTKDPDNIYPQIPGINYNDFKLTPERMPEGQRLRALNSLYNYETRQKNNFLGYQGNQNFDYMDLAKFLNISMNNIGDPFVSGNYTMNTKFVERAVLDYFASFWNAQWPHENTPNEENDDKWANSYWGYVSTGGTEANIFGLCNARDYLEGRAVLYDSGNDENVKYASTDDMPYSIEQYPICCTAEANEKNPNTYIPIAFYSQDTHYSIAKATRMLKVATFHDVGSGKHVCPLTYPNDYPKTFSQSSLDGNGWPTEVPSNDDGSIYIPALSKLVRFFANRGHPILVCFNYGTTFKGAYDDINLAVKELIPILRDAGLYKRKVIYDNKTGKFDIRTGFWFHVDGALGSAYIPFLSPQQSKGIPNFDFRINEIHSIAMSGHKWIGMPWPCGIYMSKVKYQINPNDSPNYIGSPDSTLFGSRNAFSALLLWDYFSKNSLEDLRKKADYSMEMAQYAFSQLRKLERNLEQDLWVDYSPRTFTVRFKKANPNIVFKYSLSEEILLVNGEKRVYNHIYLMGHVTRDLIDQLVKDLYNEHASILDDE